MPKIFYLRAYKKDLHIMIIKKETPVRVPNKKKKKCKAKTSGNPGTVYTLPNQTTIHGWEVKISMQSC